MRRYPTVALARLERSKRNGGDLMRPYHVLMVMAALMLASASSYAAPTTFVAGLTGALEVPASGSTATGSAAIVLDPAANTLSVHVTFSGLTSGTTAAHIHCCLDAIFETGVNVGVATTTPTFPAFPLGVTSGTYDRVLDLTLASSYNPAFITAQGGTVATAEAALIRGIQNGETYLNIHTTNFPSGEIRGFLVAVPAPARLSLLKTIPINGTAANKSNKLFSFDISWVDPANGLYYLADRSNAALDVIDTTGAFTGTPDTLFGQIGGGAVGFQGFTGNNNTSGPDGVVAAFPCIFAGDGNSRLLSFNGAASFTTIVSALPGGHTNTNGIEQPVWEPITGAFYVSLPEIDGPGDGTGITGAVAKVDTSGNIVTIYPINYCQPAGLTVGPNGDLLVGCNSVFDDSGKKCSAVVPSPIPVVTPPATTAAAHPALCG